MVVNFCKRLVYLKDNKLKDLIVYPPSLSLIKYRNHLHYLHSIRLSAAIARLVNKGYNEEILAYNVII